MTYFAAALAVLFALTGWILRRLRVQRARWLSQGPWVTAGLLVILTMLLFGPVGGFHHMFRFGILGYMVVDCDSPPEDLPIPFGRCEIRGSWLLLTLTIGVWLVLALASRVLLRRQSSRVHTR